MTPSPTDLARVKYELLRLEPEALALIGHRVSPVPKWKQEQIAAMEADDDFEEQRYQELHRRYREALKRAARSFFVGLLWGIGFAVCMITLLRCFA